MTYKIKIHSAKHRHLSWTQPMSSKTARFFTLLAAWVFLTGFAAIVIATN